MNMNERKTTIENKNPTKMLQGMLKTSSEEVNKRVEGEYGIQGLLSSDGSIKIAGYEEVLGREAVEEDQNLVYAMEVEFSGANLPNVQASYQQQYGIATEERILNKWRENKARDKNGQMEMAMTLLLSEKLGQDFLVVRTAPFDDYKNGVDNLILDKVTGDIVGAFDEVHEAGTGDRIQKKKEKVKSVAKQGGAEIRYGLKLDGGKLSRASLQGVPVFYLGLLKDELLDLEDGLDKKDSAKTDKIFKKLLISLKEQQQELSTIKSSPLFQSRLESFAKSLSRIAS